jgi:site-specific DNA-methyltransferase (adenine-specific)
MVTSENQDVAAIWAPLAAVHPWAGNPRDNAAAVDAVVASIRAYGFGAPILARQANGEIIAGHTRYLAAQQLGLPRVPVRFLDLSEAEARSLALADNKLGELATWDDVRLAALLQELSAQGVDLAPTGFTDDAIRDLLRAADEALAPVAGTDPGPEAPPEEPASVPGELYALGPHRLLCGDATVVTDLERVMDGARAAVVFTDPPYNVGYVGGTKDALTIANDAMDASAFRQFLRDAFASMLVVARPGAAIYVCHADTEGENFRGALREAGWLLKQCLIWAKDQFVLGRQDYHWQHEPILYGWAPGGAHRWHGDRKQSTVWSFDRPRRNAEHPTMKPVELVAHALANSSARGEVVLDAFGGSGTTLIAAAREGRVARVLELDPRYCDVIRRRWTTFARSAGVDPGPGALG